jgi:hypothetical protein
LSPSDISEDSPAARRHAIWRDIVIDFTQRKISFDEDRLAAFAGIAGELQAAWKSRYTAGLWAHFLAEKLLWTMVRTEHMGGRSAPKTIEYLAPTWTWISASRYGTILIEDVNIFHVDAKIIDCSVTPVAPNAPLSRVKGSHLILQLRLT